MIKLASIDYEYDHSSDETIHLVCCSVRTKDSVEDFWLAEGKDHNRLKNYLNDLHNEGYTFLAYAVQAEARSFLALGLDPLKYRWIDLYLEYRCLANNNDNYMYGKQYSKGKTRFTKRPIPKWERKTEADHAKADSSKPEYNLGAAVYKTLGIKIDNSFKTAMRDLIISAPKSFTADEQEEIQRYCSDDTKYLIPMFKVMLGEYKRLLRGDFNITTLIADMKVRSEFAVRSAIMEKIGYPINVEKTRNFSSQVPNIIWECQNDIVRQFPDKGYFRAKSKMKRFELSMDQAAVRKSIEEWMKANNFKNWIKTKGGDLSLSLKAFKKGISFSHNYPEGNFMAQMQRYLTLKQGLNGFTASSTEESSTSKKKFWDSVGSDGRVRPYMGIYVAQSARSQPSATGFIPLKSAWMRVLIEPPKGYYMYSIDYASQEYFISALLSGDKAMIKAYETGDVYLAFGKAIGYIPMDGTKETHKKERDNCKAVVLGLSYDMTEFGLAIDLSEKFGRTVSKEEALGWINKHRIAYPTLWAWKDKVRRDYRINKFLRLADGWCMWGDNDNFRSVGNVPSQGMASCIMRKAVALAQDKDLDVTYTLHDAVYGQDEIEGLKDYRDLRVLAECMDASFRYYFPEEMKSIAAVRLDADIWSPEIGEEGEFNLTYITDYMAYEMPVKAQKIYIDPRGKKEYEKFKQYLSPIDFGEVEF